MPQFIVTNLPRYLHGLTQLRHALRRKETCTTTRLKHGACHEPWAWTSPKCRAGHEKSTSSSENRFQALGLSRKITLRDFIEHVEISRNATTATQNAVARLFQTSKILRAMRFVAAAARYGHRAFISDECGQLRSVEHPRANTPPAQAPQMQRRTLRYAFRGMLSSISHAWLSMRPLA